MIKLTVFDLAGTTVHDEGGIVTTRLHQALSEAGYPVEWSAVNATMGIPKRTAIASLVPEATSDEVDSIHERFRTLILEFYRTDPSVREIEGISSLLKNLKEHSILVAFDTGFDRETTNAVLSRMPWEGLYDTSRASDEVKNGRPHPDLLFSIMEELGVSNVSDVAKVGDTPSDLGEGASAGARLNIAVCYGSHSRAQLLSEPHTHLVDSVLELEHVLLAGRVDGA